MAPSARRTAQTIAGRTLVAALLVWALASLFITASFLWTSQGTLGLSSNYGGVISSIAPGSPADRAHVAVGDLILLAQTPFESRPKLVGATTPIAIGTRVPFRLRHGSAARNITLTAVESRTTLAEKISISLQCVSATIFIFIGAALILLRPNATTWGFGLFCLLTNPLVNTFAQFPSARAHLAYVALYDIFQNVGIAGLLIFALNFPHRLDRRWRNAVSRLIPALFLLLAGWTLWIDFAICVLAIPAHTPNVYLQAAFGIVYLLAITLITETYVGGPSENRPRLRWVLLGFYVGLSCSYAGALLVYTSNLVLPHWLDNALIATEATLPLTVAYAIVRHRVIEIDFFLSRALVYAIFTSLLVLIFGAIDWIFSRILGDFRISLVLDAVASIGAAFVFDRTMRILEEAIDRTVFRARRLAQERLLRTSRSLRFVTSESTLDGLLIHEPGEALHIHALALFRRDGSTYRRAASANWPNSDCAKLARDDRLTIEHFAREGTLQLSDIPWKRDDLPQGIAAPVLSIPIRSSEHLEALLLCSLKEHGEALDPEEVRWLVSFANAAGTAYERLDTERLRANALDLQHQVELLSARLDEARRP
jgi:hypothetical protein